MRVVGWLVGWAGGRADGVKELGEMGASHHDLVTEASKLALAGLRIGPRLDIPLQ